MKFLNGLIRDEDDEEFFWAITDFGEYCNSSKMRLIMDSLLIKKIKTNEVDIGSAIKEIKELSTDKNNFSVNDIEKLLQKVITHKYEPLIAERKSLSILNSYEVLNKIFELIGTSYFKPIFIPTNEAILKIYQLYEWSYLEEFTKKDDMHRQQLVSSSLLNLFNGFDLFTALDQKREALHHLSIEEFHNRWEKKISAILNEVDYFDYEKTVKPLSEIIYNSLFHEGEDYTNLYKKTKGGQGSTNEAAFLFPIYDYLGSLKIENDILIQSINILEDESDEVFTNNCTRDEWVNSLRTNFVQIMTTLNKVRGVNTPLKEFNSSESIRTMIMRYKKNLKEDSDI